MNYLGRIFRPPSEHASLLLQVTVGCSHNRCTYCDMYRDKAFMPKSMTQIAADIDEAASEGPRHQRLFLCDGDALIMSTRRLLEVLELVREKLPWVERVGTYGDTRSVLKKSVDDLAALAQAGLGIIYHGMESGDDVTLKAIDKGGTSEEAIETARRLREAGLDHSVMVLLGVGGVARSPEHARETARVLSAMDPPYAAALTTTVVPGTPMDKAQSAGTFTLPDKFTMLQELRTIIAYSEFSACRFSANHASNYLPLRGTLPQDKPHLLRFLDAVIAEGDESMLKPDALRGL